MRKGIHDSVDDGRQRARAGCGGGGGDDMSGWKIEDGK